MDGNRWNAWMIAGLVVVVAAAAAGFAYDFGLARGLAQAGSSAPSYGWHRHGGFGFFPGLFFVIFVVMAIRGFWWRPWRPWSYYSGPPPHARDRFDEWHRRAHERMKGNSDS